MKKQILTILTCLASITAFAQTTEIKLSFDNFTPITVSRESGEMLFGDQIYTKLTQLVKKLIIEYCEIILDLI